MAKDSGEEKRCLACREVFWAFTNTPGPPWMDKFCSAKCTDIYEAKYTPRKKVRERPRREQDDEG